MGFYHQIWGFPVNFPVIQFYEWDLRPKSRDVMVVNDQGFTNGFIIFLIYIGFISIKVVPGCLPKLENIMKHHSSNIYIQ